MKALQNLGLGTISLLVGFIVDALGYFWLEIFFIGCLCLSITASVVMWVLDYLDANYLNMTASQRALFEQTPKYKRMMDIEILLPDEGEEEQSN